MKRFLNILGLLTVALLLLTSGVNATLDHLDRASSENTFVCYDDKGQVVFTFTGAQALAQKMPRPVRATTGALFHRADDSVASTVDPAAEQSRYF
jgi:hypothetical protein